MHLSTIGLAPLVVAFDGHYTWSFTPRRDARPVDREQLVPWPAAMLPYLSGVAKVRITDVSRTTEHFHDDVTFGAGAGRVALVDADGFALSIDKAGHLGRAFEETDESQRAEILDGVLRLLDDLRDHCHIEAFLNFGALLGAVREGNMLGHDSDVDLAYVSRMTSPAEVILESYGIERELKARGWRLVRMTGHDLKVFLPLSDGTRCQVDIFQGFFVDGLFYLLPNRSGALPLDDIVPLSSVSLLGRDLPAPRRPEAMLEYLYGEHWRVPDPSFQFDNPPAGVRRINGWLRGAQHNVHLWINHWNSPEGKAQGKPSDFARWVEQSLPAGEGIAELGCGRGTDAFFFARQGRHTIAADYARSSILHVRTKAAERPNLPLEPMILQLGDLRHALWLGARLAREPHHLYGRQLLGSLTQPARECLWRLCSMSLRDEAKVFLEFSATGPGLDPAPPTRHGMTQRLDARLIHSELEAHGGVVEYHEVGPGVDAWGHLDAAVCRIVASWRGRGPAQDGLTRSSLLLSTNV